MPEADTGKEKNFLEDVPTPDQGFFLKGASAYDWGMKNRLARIFRPDTGRTVMLAIDHGYFQGPTSGLERVDLGIVPIAPHADALMLTRGILRSTIPATHRGGIVMRASGGPSVLKELSNERIAVDLEDAPADERPRARGAGVHRRRARDAVGPQHDPARRRRVTGTAFRCSASPRSARSSPRDARYLGLATRICAELGAQFVKTYYGADGFEQVTAGCPVPIVMAGGKKLPELDALEMAYRAVQEGALESTWAATSSKASTRGDAPRGRERRARRCTASGSA